MSFRDPLFLLLLLVLPPVIYFYLKQGRGSLRYSSVKNLKNFPPSWRIRLRPLLLFLYCAATALFVIALARPQKGIEETKITTEGIDIILTVDVSGSMRAEDFTLKGKYVNRLEAVKEAVRNFISERVGDRIGLVLFAGRPYTQCPLTLDYGILLNLLEKAKIGMIEDGTAIGSALATSVNRLKDSTSKSKVIILLSDGANNAGSIDPLTAATLAKTYGIKVYTIGAGTRGQARYPVKDFFGNKVYRPVSIPIDEETLKQIAQITGGSYFRATDTKLLFSIYNMIDRLEKTTAEVTVYVDYNELFPYFLFPGLILLILNVGLNNTLLRKLP